jgi:hypothetical protein
MPTTQQREQDQDLELHSREALNVLIGEQVIHTLGAPNGLQRVQVRYLWKDRYRVNVLIGPDAASVKVNDSFFLRVDDDGQIVSSTPDIVKRY